MPAGLYAVMESAFPRRQGWSVSSHRDRLAALYARLSAIVVDNPHAWERRRGRHRQFAKGARAIQCRHFRTRARIARHGMLIKRRRYFFVGFRKDNPPFRRNRASYALKSKGASGTDRGGRRPFSPEFRGTFALRGFSTRRYRAFGPAGASDTVLGVRPASRPCVRRDLPSAWFAQARQLFLRRGACEGSEGGCRGRGAPVEVVKDLFDHGWIFNARDHFHRTAAGFAGLDVDLEHALQALHPTSSRRGVRALTRQRARASRRPRLAGVTCTRSR